MSKSETFIVNFIAKGATPDEWRIVLVEEDWRDPVEDRLRELQTRLFNCIDAVLDGQLAEKYPETFGKRIVIQIEFFGRMQHEVESFVSRFSRGVFADTDYGSALKKSRFAEEISFEVNFNEKAERDSGGHACATGGMIGASSVSDTTKYQC
jgi:hypothetical protein